MEKLIFADIWVFNYLRHWVGRYDWLDSIWIVLALWLIYLLPILLIAAWFWSSQTKRVALKAAIAAFLAWEVFSKIVAGLVDRERPSQSILGVKELIFHRPDTSFPSDHAAAIFSVAIVFRLIGHRKLGNGLFVIGGLIAISRVMAGVHFPLDVIAGAAIGTVVGWIIYKLRNPIDRYITEPIIRLANKVGL